MDRRLIVSKNSGIDVSGTHLQGYVTTTYAKLVATFGEPNSEFDDCKSQAEWNLLTDAGDVVTIYDYKMNVIPVEDVTDWHIGGRVPAVVQWVNERLSQ